MYDLVLALIVLTLTIVFHLIQINSIPLFPVDDINEKNGTRVQIAISDMVMGFQTSLSARYMSKLVPLKMDSNNISFGNLMSLLLEYMKSLIKLQMTMSIDLILCCIYENYSKKFDFFFNVLECTIIECLDGNDKSDKNHKNINYQWFKYCALNSNVRLVTGLNNNNNNSNKTRKKTKSKYIRTVPTEMDMTDKIKTNTILFANKLLVQQKEFIWKNVKKMQENEMNDAFETLCHFDANTDTYGTELKQDEIAGGIVSNTNKYDSILQKVNKNNNDLSCFAVVVSTPKANKAQDWQQTKVRKGHLLQTQRSSTKNG